jgi:hypothetical protein
MQSWKTRILISGGSIAGVIAALLMVRKAETTNTQPQLTPADGVKIGVGLLGLIKLISDSGDSK